MVSVIVVTYNSERTIEACLNSVYSQKPADIVDIFLVDNASQDRTCEIVKEKFTDVALIANSENKGFAAACNQAIMEAKGDYILLLNPDAVLQQNCLNILHDFMTGNPKCAASGPSLWMPDSTFQSSAFSFPTFSWAFFHLLRLSDWLPWKASFRRIVESSSKQPDQNQQLKVDWVTGACIMLKRESINEEGMFDENYFLFFEEIDWCKRAIKKGWMVFYIPRARVTHEIGVSSKSARVLSIVSRYRSMAYYFKKHYGMTGYIYVKVLLFLFFISRIFFLKLFYSRQPEAREKINAYIQVLFS